MMSHMRFSVASAVMLCIALVTAPANAAPVNLKCFVFNFYPHGGSWNEIEFTFDDATRSVSVNSNWDIFSGKNYEHVLSFGPSDVMQFDQNEIDFRTPVTNKDSNPSETSGGDDRKRYEALWRIDRLTGRLDAWLVDTWVVTFGPSTLEQVPPNTFANHSIADGTHKCAAVTKLF